MRGQHWILLLLWFSTHTLCWTGSHQDNWGTGSGRCPASPLPHRWLHRRWEVRLMEMCLIQRQAFCTSIFSFPCENKCKTCCNGWWFTREYSKCKVNSWHRLCCTFVDRWKAFAHPAAAASEFNPQSTVSRNDGIWKCVSTKTACRSTWENNDTTCQ